MIKLLITYLVFALCIDQLAYSKPQKESFVVSRNLTVAERIAGMSVVSMVKIISNPQNFAGKILAVRGFLHIEYEDNRLYLTQEHADHLMKENALEVSFLPNNLLLESRQKFDGETNTPALPKDRQRALHYFNNKHVLLVGYFKNGQLVNVSRVMELPVAK
ncbi:MAG: hypothetical protein K2X27_01490 [Candidatus Obscuribacterales bacterium]|nr:hypothetical protein [Candidatus Obscuribacterales bacterium]